VSGTFPEVGSTWMFGPVGRSPRQVTITRIDQSSDYVYFVPGAIYEGEDGISLQGFLARATRVLPEPGSRWLDPASVPVGPPLSVCYPSVCCWPSRMQPAPGRENGPGNACPSCYARSPRVWDCRNTPILPPSALTPAPRWRSLIGTKWSCGRPGRTYSASLIVWLRSHGSKAVWQGRALRTSRVRKVVSAASRPPYAYASIAEARWVVA